MSEHHLPDNVAWLVADIGGTNARFALAERHSGHILLREPLELPAADFPSLGAAARHYLQQQSVAPIHAVFAVASPVTGDRIRFTNSPWVFSIAALREELRLTQLDVINDFAAIGHAAAALMPADLREIGGVPTEMQIKTDGRYVVLGPGTGMGVCGLLRRGGRSTILETEGGHVGFAPSDGRELRVLDLLLRRFGRVSAERLLSGPGLLNLHGALCELDDLNEIADTPAAIGALAARDPHSRAAEAIGRFAEMLGSFAGDMVLAHGAWDGVYLAGGITAKLLPAIEAGGFRARFEAKGRFRALLQQVPVRAVLHPQPGLLGAAAFSR